MPFKNGQWVDEGDFDYAGKFYGGAANSRLRSAYESENPADFNKAAGYLAASGDARKAAEIYAQARQIGETKKRESYMSETAQAYAKGDYTGAKNAAAAYGDPQGVIAAQEQETAQQKREREQAHQTGRRYYGALRQIATMPPAQRTQAYQSLLAQAKQETQASGGDASWIDSLPQEWDDQAASRLGATLRTIAEAAMSPGEWAKFQADQEEAQRKAQAPIEMSAGSTLVTPDGRPIYTAPRQFAPNERMGGSRYEPLSAEDAAQWNVTNPSGWMMDNKTGKPSRMAGVGAAALDSRSSKMLEKGDDTLSNARAFKQEATRWLQLNRKRATGGTMEKLPGSPSSIFDADLKEMEGITARVTPMMRAPGSGTMSDKDVDLFQRGTLSTANPGSVNANIALAMIEAAKNAEGYSEFLDEWTAQKGSVYGATEAWNQYLNANPIFRDEQLTRSGAVNTRRPVWRDWFSQAPPPQGNAGAPTRRIRLEP